MVAAAWLKRRYGDRIEIEFHDLDASSTSTQFPEIVQATRAGKLPLPVIEVDGKLHPQRFFGEWAVIDVAEAALAG